MPQAKAVFLFVLGFALTVLGTTVVLQQWESVVLAFKAVIGPVMAVAGLVIMFAAGIKRP